MVIGDDNILGGGVNMAYMIQIVRSATSIFKYITHLSSLLFEDNRN